MKNYSSYKNTGVDWLEFIPSHWSLRKMKYTFDEKSDKGYASLPLLSATQNHGVIKKSEYENRTVEATKSLDTLKLVEVGDFVISLRSFQGGIEYSYERGIISPAYTILRPTHILSSYFKYLGKSPAFIQLLKSMVTGIREGQNIDYSKLRENLLPIPPKKEQEVIASYLDAATAKIDEAIAQQQRMIDLLNERKKIVINHAVTKGFNPNVKYKETGIAWIGVIPEHWQLMQLRYTVSNHDNLRQPITADQRERNNPQYDYYGASGIIDKIDHYNVDDKVLLIGEDGANLVLRNLPLVYKAEGKFWVNNHAHILKPKGNDYDFMALVLEAADYTLFITGSAQPKLSQANMNAVKLPIPPIEEQREIVAGIKPQLERIDTFIEQCSSIVALLEERKQIIINDVVTGKVRVV